MKNPLGWCVAALLAGMSAVTAGQHVGGHDGARERLVGAWRLVSLEHKAAGRPPGSTAADCLSSRATDTCRCK